METKYVLNTLFSFLYYSNILFKFAVTDGDGCVSLWQMSHGAANIKKPFFVRLQHNHSLPDWFNWLF